MSAQNICRRIHTYSDSVKICIELYPPSLSDGLTSKAYDGIEIDGFKFTDIYENVREFWLWKL